MIARRRRSTNLQTEIEAATKEARAIEDELGEIDREVVLGKDLAGVGDQELLAARDLRVISLIAALDTEHAALDKPRSIGARRSGRSRRHARAADAQIDQLDR